MYNLHPGANLLPGAKLHPGENCYHLCSVHMSINCVHMLLDLLFKHITNDRRVRKMQLHLVLFALFIYAIFKEDNSPVICIHGPHLRG